MSLTSWRVWRVWWVLWVRWDWCRFLTRILFSLRGTSEISPGNLHRTRDRFRVFPSRITVSVHASFCPDPLSTRRISVNDTPFCSTRLSVGTWTHFSTWTHQSTQNEFVLFPLNNSKGLCFVSQSKKFGDLWWQSNSTLFCLPPKKSDFKETISAQRNFWIVIRKKVKLTRFRLSRWSPEPKNYNVCHEFQLLRWRTHFGRFDLNSFSQTREKSRQNEKHSIK